MIHHPDLPPYQDVMPNLNAARDTHLRNNYRILTNDDIMSDLNQIVSLDSALNPGLSEGGPVNTIIGPNLYMIIYLDNTYLWNL